MQTAMNKNWYWHRKKKCKKLLSQAGLECLLRLLDETSKLLSGSEEEPKQDEGTKVANQSKCLIMYVTVISP